MTVFKKSVTAALFAAIAIAVGVFATFDFDGAPKKYCEAGVYDLLNADVIELYETDIAGEKIISNQSATQLARKASRLDIPVEKLKAVLLLQDFAGRTGRSVNLSELAEMSDLKLLALFKQCADDYLGTQPQGRRAELEQKLKKCLGM